jgi:hypothetical protein
VLVYAVTFRVAYGQFGVIDTGARDLLRQAAVDVGDDQPDLRAYVLSYLAFYEAVMEGRGHAVDPLVREALSLARRSGDDMVLADVLTIRSYVLQGSSDVALQRTTLDEIRQVNERLTNRPTGDERDRATRYESMWWERWSTGLRHEGVLRLQTGDREGFREVLAELQETGERLRDWFLPAATEMWQGLLAALEGRWDDATRHSNDMLCRAQDDLNFQLSWTVVQFVVARERGELARIEPLIHEIAQRSPLPTGQTPTLLLHLDTDRLDEASFAAKAIMDIGLDEVAQALAGTFALAALAEAWSRIDDPEAAAAVEDLLLPYHGQLLVVAWGVHVVGAADRYLAMLASRAKRWREADERFASALALEERLSARPLATRTRVCWARSLLDRPASSPEAGALLARAATDAAALNMARLSYEVAEMKAAQPKPSSGQCGR